MNQSQSVYRFGLSALSAVLVALAAVAIGLAYPTHAAPVDDNKSGQLIIGRDDDNSGNVLDSGRRRRESIAQPHGRPRRRPRQ